MFNSKVFRNVLLVATVVMLATGSLWAAEATKKARTNTGVLWAIPNKSLICVKIRQFDGTLDSVNAFLEDVAPINAKEALMSKLTGMLGGDGRLRGVNKKGTIAIFALPVESDSPAMGPFGNMFIGALLPTTKYENFVSRNENVGKPDEQGISTISVNGNPMGLATNFRRFALICPPNARGQLATVKKMLNRRKQSLASGLDAETRKQAATSPVWVYVNVKQASMMIQPMLFGGLQKMKSEIEKAKEQGEEIPMDPAAIVNFYGGILKAVLTGTENVTLALAPSEKACSLTVGLKPVPDTIMASMVGKPMGGDLDHMLGYLEDGAMFNVAGKVDHDGLKTVYVGLFKLMGSLVPGGLSDAQNEELEQLLTEGIDAMGDAMAVTAGVEAEASPQFWGKCVFEVSDRSAFVKFIEDELKLMKKGGVLSEVYKGFGIEMDVEVDRNADTYKGVQIGAAKLGMEAAGEGEASAMMGKAFEKLFGDGLDYKWAVEKETCVYTVGADADGAIRKLIDQVKAGGPKKTGSEIKAALAVIPDSEKADVVGTVNMVRYMKLVAGFIATFGEVEIPEIEASTKSNIAFAGRTTQAGNLLFHIVMPKEHLLETKSVFENVIPKIKEQERLKREKQKAQANNF